MIKRYGPGAMMAAGALLIVVGTATGLPITIPGMTIALAGLIVVGVMHIIKKLSKIERIEARQLALAQADELLHRPIDRSPPARRHRGDIRRPHRCRHRRDGGMGLAGGLAAIPAVVGGWLYGTVREHAVQTATVSAAVATLPIASYVAYDQPAPPVTVTEVVDAPAVTITERIIEERVVVVEEPQLISDDIADEPEPPETEEEEVPEVLAEPAGPADTPEPIEQPESEPEFEMLGEPAEEEPEPAPTPEPVDETPEPAPEPVPEPDPDPTRGA